MKKGKLKENFKNNKLTILTAVAVLLCIVFASAAIFAFSVDNKLDLINRNEFKGNPDVTFAYDDEDSDVTPDLNNYGTINDVEQASSLKELMKKWATDNDKKISDKDVVNVLLIGEDGNGSSQRSDTAMLVSVNTKTRKIVLTSFLRDSYSYMNIRGEDRYDKLNHAYAWGGPKKLIETIENNYKINIDYYVSINFNSFVEAIDMLGGVQVSVTKTEADYMNKTTKIKGFKSGDNVLLDGEHALIFARIRKLDSEVNRTERQRRLIAALINSAKNTSIGEANDIVNRFLPYITTNCSNSKIISLASKAIAEQWYNFDVVGNAAPFEDNRTGVNGFRTYSGNLFVWIVDYTKDAYCLQLAIYGQSNIKIDDKKHISAAELAKEYIQYNASKVEVTTDNSTEITSTTNVIDEPTENTSVPTSSVTTTIPSTNDSTQEQPTEVYTTSEDESGAQETPEETTEQNHTENVVTDSSEETTDWQEITEAEQGEND